MDTKAKKRVEVLRKKITDLEKKLAGVRREWTIRRKLSSCKKILPLRRRRLRS